MLTLLSCLASHCPIIAQPNVPLTVSIQVIGERGAESITLRWNATQGKEYNVLAASELSERAVWTKLNSQPISSGSSLLTFTDPLQLGATVRFYRVEEEQSGEVQLTQMGKILPLMPNVPLGQSVQFRVVFPDGGTGKWRIIVANDNPSGAISEDGLYTAPKQRPALPFVSVQSENLKIPGMAIATVATLFSEEELRISREQAIAVLMQQVIDSHPRKQSILASPWRCSAGWTTCALRFARGTCWWSSYWDTAQGAASVNSAVAAWPSRFD
ncbi:MAG: hypothetical protein HY735_20965 [Verrucomicrobia bacterium]|nr:hypothetical protein [Verrucomicrobiota bacterium]